MNELRRLRKKFRLNQEDITDDSIKRELISMIENGKSTMTPKSAITIAGKFNDYFNFMEIRTYVDWYVLIDNERISNFIKLIDTLNNHHKKTKLDLLDILARAKKHGIHSLNGYIYAQLGDQYGLEKNFTKQYEYYSLALDNMLRYSEITHQADLLIKMFDSLILLKRYEEVLITEDLLVPSLDKFDKRIAFKILFKLIESHNYLGNYSHSLNLIELLSNFTNSNDYESMISTLNLKGMTYMLSKDFEQAKNTFQTTLFISKSSKIQYLETLFNTVEASIAQGDYISAEPLINELTEMFSQESANTLHRCRGLYEIAKFLIEFKNSKNEALPILEEAIYSSVILNNVTSLFKTIELMIDHYDLQEISDNTRHLVKEYFKVNASSIYFSDFYNLLNANYKSFGKFCEFIL